MDSLLVGTFPKFYSYSFTTTSSGNLRRSKHCAINYYSIASSCAPKASRHKRKIQNECNILRFWQPSLNHHCEGVEGQSKYQECNREFAVKAAPEQSFESEHPAFDPKNILDVVKNILDAFYRFSRPHTVIGTGIKHNFRVTPCSGQIIRYIPIIFYRCVGGCSSCPVYEYLHCSFNETSHCRIQQGFLCLPR
jgi:hypothetical protein